MLNDFRLALRALLEPVAWRVVLFGLFLAIAVLTLLGSLALWGLMATDFMPLERWPRLRGGVSFVLVAAAAYFLFAPVFSACAGLFTEYVADAVERRHYPTLPTPRNIGVWEQFRTGFDFIRRSLSRNLIVLPFYALPGPNILIFVLANRSPMAYEYFMTVALRRYEKPVATQMYETNSKALRRTGSVIALISILPFLNLVAPVVATALMTHKAARMTP